jgi:hypothetical protein
MERLVIIDHETHNLYIEDVDEEMLERDYEGSEEAYIEDTYSLGKHWSWDFVTNIEYIPMADDGDPITLEPMDLL